MYNYQTLTLDNGLRIVCNEDNSTALVAVDLLYDVGAKHEKTGIYGIAHLFEHLMFGGSVHFPQFDSHIEGLCGESNAFTNNDITNYYIVLPAQNLTDVLQIEADRMRNLILDSQKLEIQKNVVSEEFKQRYLNVPYGDLWKQIREMCYEVHPYCRQTIGTCLQDIENIFLNDARAFYDHFYQPHNAILSICGNINAIQTIEICKKTFETIPKVSQNHSQIIIEPEPQWSCSKTEIVQAEVPASIIAICYQMCNRQDPEYYIYDLISDLLSSGKSSQIYRSLVTDAKLFTEISACITGDDDSGLFVVMGKLSDGVSIAQAEEAILQELHTFAQAPVTESQLQKVKNKNESNHTFVNMKALERAMNFAYYLHIGSVELINTEPTHYAAMTAAQIHSIAAKMFLHSHSRTLHYCGINL